ncbi:MAG TPA: Rieske 2Fe-2S domain-containing protein [Acidimicrobiales bacterium]
MSSWMDIAAYDELRRRRKMVVQHEGTDILVLIHEGVPYAFQNRCIHRNRELHRGVILNGRIVCPGHQWSFELGSGREKVNGECQPTFEVKVEDGRVLLDVESRALRGAAPA